jgi:hypothetical protein
MAGARVGELLEFALLIQVLSRVRKPLRLRNPQRSADFSQYAANRTSVNGRSWWPGSTNNQPGAKD